MILYHEKSGDFMGWLIYFMGKKLVKITKTCHDFFLNDLRRICIAFMGFVNQTSLGGPH